MSLTAPEVLFVPVQEANKDHSQTPQQLAHVALAEMQEAGDLDDTLELVIVFPEGDTEAEQTAASMAEEMATNKYKPVVVGSPTLNNQISRGSLESREYWFESSPKAKELLAKDTTVIAIAPSEAVREVVDPYAWLFKEAMPLANVVHCPVVMATENGYDVPLGGVVDRGGLHPHLEKFPDRVSEGSTLGLEWTGGRNSAPVKKDDTQNFLPVVDVVPNLPLQNVLKLETIRELARAS